MYIVMLSVSLFVVLYIFKLDPKLRQFLIAFGFSLVIMATVDNMYRNMLINLLLGKDMNKQYVIAEGAHCSIFEIFKGVTKKLATHDAEDKENHSIRRHRVVRALVQGGSLEDVAARKAELHKMVSEMNQELATLITMELVSYTADSTKIYSSNGSQHSRQEL
jgi:hypothetical protein